MWIHGKAARRALVVTLGLALLIVLGSRNLARFDAALVAYTFATLFASFGITYRYGVWLERPPTALYWRRGWEAFFRRGFRLRNAGLWFRRVGSDFALNLFIWRRNRLRGLTHGLLMWGCLLAAAITFPLVFGWLSFVSLPGHPEIYRVMLFGFPTAALPADSLPAFLVFHGLVWSAFLVIAGVMLAMRRRMRDEGAVALQLFAEDFLPLLLLFAVSLSGLLLTVSYTWLKGYGYSFLAVLHAATVIITLLWLPFGKLFHVFQRPAQIGVEFYKDLATAGERERCRRCDHPFASRQHVEDLIRVEAELGYRYGVTDGPLDHYQRVCPRCRRALFALAQASLKQSTPLPMRGGPAPEPAYANAGLGEGPLGVEDRDNFHP